MTCLDGYQMARKGRAGAALAIAALGSLFAGTVATLLHRASQARRCRGSRLQFGAAEYFSLMVLGLVGSIVLAHGSLLKAVAMVLLGLLLGLVGTDVNSGRERYTFGIPALSDGIGFVPVAMGLFGIAEIIVNLEKRERRVGDRGDRQPDADARGIPPRLCRRCCAAPRIGSMLGVLPGGGALLRLVRAPMRSRRRCRARTRRASARARSKAWRRRNRPTMPARRPRSFRCSRSASRRTRSWR